MPRSKPKKETLEFEGKTIEQATEYACKHFSLPKEDLEIEVLNKGFSGIFGLGGRKAKIRAVPNATKQASDINKPAPAAATTGPGKDGLNPIEESDQTAKMPVTPLQPREAPPHIEEARRLTDELLAKMGLDCNAETRNEGDGLDIEITGQDVSIAIGHEGKTLEAIGYIVNRVLTKQFEDAKTVLIDAGNFHPNRENYLAKLAHSKAEQARKTGKSVVLNPMSPKERRLVHLALKNLTGIRTASTGTGTMRRVIIIPARRTGKTSSQRTDRKSE